jgi:hypothetical protein
MQNPTIKFMAVHYRFVSVTYIFPIYCSVPKFCCMGSISSWAINNWQPHRVNFEIYSALPSFITYVMTPENSMGSLNVWYKNFHTFISLLSPLTLSSSVHLSILSSCLSHLFPNSPWRYISSGNCCTKHALCSLHVDSSYLFICTKVW